MMGDANGGHNAANGGPGFGFGVPVPDHLLGTIYLLCFFLTGSMLQTYFDVSMNFDNGTMCRVKLIYFPVYTVRFNFVSEPSKSFPLYTIILMLTGAGMVPILVLLCFCAVFKYRPLLSALASPLFSINNVLGRQ